MNRSLKICTIGGGTGMPVINQALIEAGFESISSIVTTFDSGGDSGRMRTDERGKILAFSDYWRSLISLWKDGKQKELWQEMLRFRDGRSRNFGNTFFQFMAEKVGDLSEVDTLFSKLTGAEICGDVIPVSTTPTDLCFETESGKKYCGENNLDDLRMSKDKVKKVWLYPDVKASPKALIAMRQADVIIVCPGSMYGSVITNLLPIGMSKVYQKSKAIKILMTNLMSVANENGDFSQNKYVKVFEKYIGKKNPFDYVIMADLEKLDQRVLKKVLQNYDLEYSKPIKIEMSKGGFKTLVADIAIIETDNLRLRHSVTKLAQFFSDLKL